jgi:hypothetical protein
MNKFYKHIVLLLFLFLFLASTKETNAETYLTHQYWFDYNPVYYFSNENYIHNQVSMNTIKPNEWWRYSVESEFHHNLPKYFLKNLNYRESFLAGLKFIYTFNKNSHNRLEIRPYQGYHFEFPRYLVFTINHYFQLDERFDMDAVDWVNTFGLRLQYKATITTKFSAGFVNLPYYFFIPVNLEFYWNLLNGKQFNDVRRYVIGFGYEFSPSFNASFNLGWHNTRNTIEDNFATDDIVFRLRIHHYFNPPK